jgi:NAD-dependent deacetylase
MRLAAGRFGQIVILTGAGISAESGLATFRDAGGLWEQHDPREIATPEAFRANPQLVYRFYNARVEALQAAQPNPAHIALAQLQARLPGRVHIITQNVDDLHERAGSVGVLHMHGQLDRKRCNSCGHVSAVEGAYDGSTACERCGLTGVLRPDVVWFGEMPYHMDVIELLLQACDLFVAIGTSGSVYPAADFVRQARQAGAETVEVNLERSEVAEFFHQHRLGPAATEVPRLVAELLTDA